MELIKLADIKRLSGQFVATIGMFDGVHLGHQKILKQMKQLATSPIKTIVITFYPHPDYVLDKRDNFGYIDSIESKANFLANYDIDYLLVIEFTHELALLSPNDFLKLIEPIDIVTFVVGSDFRFGFKGQGNYADLQKRANVVIVGDVTFNHQKLGSENIRALLSNGDVLEVSKLLGRNYYITGTVSYGRQIGHTLGFPTANIEIEKTFLKNGVYVVKVGIKDKYYYGLGNLGNNPTLNYVKTRRLEVHILNFNENIYEQQVRVEFIDFIRDEIKFETKEQLINQITQDVNMIKQYI